MTKLSPNGMSLIPSNDAGRALQQIKRSFGTAWTELDPKNPSVKLVACESTVGARVNSYADGKWVQRRVADDTLVALVELQDGSQTKMMFRRGVLDSGWQRVSSA